MSKSNIFLTKVNQSEAQTLVIEGDEHSVWAYLLNSSQKVELDGFICSRGTLVESGDKVREFLDKGFQPPLVEALSNENSVQLEINEESIKIHWENGVIQVLVHSKQFLKMDIHKKISYSLAISKEGPYGTPLVNVSDI